MLPDSTLFTTKMTEEKFADLAIPLMVREINKSYDSSNLIAKIAGGASMFKFGDNGTDSIGYKNVLAVEQKLRELGIPILGRDTGGNKGRTMMVDLEDFTVSIRTVDREIIKL